MAKKYDVKTASGSITLPIADGTITTPLADEKDMDLNFDDGVFVVAFYDASGNPVTPSAGTVVAEMSPIDGQWLAPSSGDATIDATQVIAGSALYGVPRFSGPAIQGRVTFSGITGPASAKAYFWRTRQNNNQ